MHITISATSKDELENAANAGFRGIDMQLTYYTLREDLLHGELMGRLIERATEIHNFGFTTEQTHLVYWPSHAPILTEYNDWAEHLIPMMKKEIEFTASIGGKIAVMHPFYVQDGRRELSRDGNKRAIEALLPTLENCGVTLALENIYGSAGSDAHHETAEDMLYYTDRYDTPYLGLCLDTGHAIMRGQDPIQMVKAYQNKLCALHIHASIDGHDTHSIPLSEDDDRFDWYAFADALKSINYNGNFNLECRPHYSNYPLESYAEYYTTAYTSATKLMELIK